MERRQESSRISPSDAIAGAILSLRDDPACRVAMGAAAMRNASERFSCELMLDKWEAFLLPRAEVIA